MLFAEAWDSFEGWAKAVVGALVGAGGAAGTILGVWRVYRKQRLRLAADAFELQKREAAAVLEAARDHQEVDRAQARADERDRQEAREADAQSLKEVIADLRRDTGRQRAQYDRLQESVVERLAASTQKLSECEKNHAVLEERLRVMAAALGRTEAELASNTKYTKTLEERIRVLELGRGKEQA